MNDEATAKPEDEVMEMDEDRFETFLADAIREGAEESDIPGLRVRTFEEDGVLTRNHGLVVRVGETEFQITIVKSR